MSRNQFINFVSAEEAAKLIPDNAVIASACFGNGGWPHELAYAMEDRFLETGHPANITHIHAAGCGDFGKNGHGECHWSHDDQSYHITSRFFAEAHADDCRQ